MNSRSDLTFEAGYLGSISRHLESYRGISAAVPGPGTDRQPVSLSEFGLLVLVENGGRGNYNSLGTKLTKRYSNGVDRTGRPTPGRSRSTPPVESAPPTATLFSRRMAGACSATVDPSAFDNRHRLVVSGLYDLPFGKGRKSGIKNRVPECGRRRMAGRRHHHLARRIPDQPVRRREPRQHQHQ